MSQPNTGSLLWCGQSAAMHASVTSVSTQYHQVRLAQVTDPRGASGGKWDCFASYRLALVHPTNEAKTIARDSWHRFSGAVMGNSMQNHIAPPWHIAGEACRLSVLGFVAVKALTGTSHDPVLYP